MQFDIANGGVCDGDIEIVGVPRARRDMVNRTTCDVCDKVHKMGRWAMPTVLKCSVAMAPWRHGTGKVSRLRLDPVERESLRIVGNIFGNVLRIA